MRAQFHPKERERLETLRSYDVLDTPQEADFNDLVALAADICGTPISLVSLVDESRQWFKASFGVDVQETPLEVSICSHTILQGGLFEVPDASQDERFKDNPLVAGEPGLRFYAGVTLMAENGLPLGALCVLDTVPRQLDRRQRMALKVLGREVMTQLDLRHKVRETEQAREEAAAASKLLKVVTDRLPVRVAYVDREYRYQFINDAYERELGLDREDVIGQTVADVISDPVFEVGRERLARALSGHTHTEEFDVPYHSGQRRVRSTYVPDFDENGEVQGVVCHVLDVTEQRRMEQAIEEQRARQDRMLATAHVATFDWDIPNDRVYGNRILGRLFGIEESDGLGEPISTYLSSIHPEDIGAASAAIQNSILTGKNFESKYRVLDGNGVERSVLARGDATLDEEGRPLRLTGVVLDISELSRSELALRTSEERFRQLVELSPSTVWFGEPDGGLSYISHDFYEATGLTPEEALPHGWASRVHPDDLPVVGEAWTFARNNETPYDTEMRIRHKDDSYRWISARALPVRDEEGLVRGWLGSNSDIHEKKSLEELLLSRVEERTQELESALKEAEGFNYSISHDLRSPLRAISATAGILLEEALPNLSPHHQDLLQRQAHNAARLARLIDELLRLSRLSRVEVKRVPLDITAKAKALAIEMEAQCEVVVQEGMTGQGDAGLVRTVLQNLIDNACKFSPDRIPVIVGQTGNTFWVRDQGIGFDMKYEPKIFLPFERLVLDSEFPGTGIGLANVKRIVERHGGRVWAESEPGKGTTFYFTLGS